MRNKILYITRTALMLALLITLQWATKAFGQIVTGSCVNGVLAVTALCVGLPGGITVAVLSPIFAFLLGIAPNVVTVPVIMLGNASYVLIFALLRKVNWANWGIKISALALACVAKFSVMYALVKWVICGVLADGLLAQGVLKPPMLNVLPTTFGVAQLLTALLGGALAIVVESALTKIRNREGE